MPTHSSAVTQLHFPNQLDFPKRTAAANALIYHRECRVCNSVPGCVASEISWLPISVLPANDWAISRRETHAAKALPPRVRDRGAEARDLAWSTRRTRTGLSLESLTKCNGRNMLKTDSISESGRPYICVWPGAFSRRGHAQHPHTRPHTCPPTTSRPPGIRNLARASARVRDSVIKSASRPGACTSNGT